ncbi:MAG: peptide-methionine (S)-S-oxide reductase, partial [Bacillota bacterium]
EVVEVIFDPEEVTYPELLEVFGEVHDPTTRSSSRQYASLIFVSDEEDRDDAEAFLQELESDGGTRAFTEIVPTSTFYPAEDYHQKYYLQAEDLLWEEILADAGSFWEAVDSTRAARINGYLAGYGSPERLEEDLPSLELSSRAAAALTDLVGR